MNKPMSFPEQKLASKNANAELYADIAITDDTLFGTAKLRNAPIKVDFNLDEAIKVTDAFVTGFYSPITAAPAAPPVASIQTIATDSSHAQHAAAQSVYESINSTFAVDHIENVRQIFTDFDAKQKKLLNAIDTSAMGLNEKAGILNKLYWGTQGEPGVYNQLQKQYEKDKENLDTWFKSADGYDKLKTIYPAELKTGDPEKDGEKKEAVKTALKNELTQRHDLELKQLKAFELELTEACNNIKKAHATIEENALFNNHYPGSQGVVRVEGETPFTDGNRYTKSGKHFDINEEGGITLDFTGNDSSEATRAEDLFEAMLTLKQDGNDTINIGSLAEDPEATFFTPKGARFNQNKAPVTNNMDRFAFKQAVRAGFELNKISFSSGYRIDDADIKFYRDYRTKKAYAEFSQTHPTLHSILTNSANEHLKTGKARDLGPNQAPELTAEERTKLRETDWLDVKDEKAFATILNGVRTGLGDTITLQGSQAMKESLIRDLRSDMIVNPEVRRVLCAARLPDDNSPLLDHLTKEQIHAINYINFSKCENTDEVVNLINAAIGVKFTPLAQLNNTVNGLIDISQCNYELNKSSLADKAVNLVKKNNKTELVNFSHVKANLSPEKVNAAQSAANQNKLINTSTYSLQDALEGHKNKVMGERATTGLVERIENSLATIDGETSMGFTLNQALCRDQIRANELAENYNELIWHTQNQIKELDLLCETLGSQRFLDEDVTSAYDKLLTEQLVAIDISIKTLKNAGIIKVPGVNGQAVQKYPLDSNTLRSTVSPPLQTKASFGQFKIEATTLAKSKVDLLTKVAERTGYKVNKLHIVQGATQANTGSPSNILKLTG